MKIPQRDYVEQEQIGDLKEITSSISEKNLSLVLDNVTKNLYADPIGAFVRELTSNGVDANKRNSKSEKVKVRIYREGTTHYFEVKDEGTGMTPEVFEKVYMSWFESDKRNDDNQIGGYGIGSKSPLAYSESYEVTTIAEGIQYEYEIVRQAPAPTATLLNSFETNKKSGTTVRVEIRDEDRYKVHRAAIRQLVYFNEVIVTDEMYYYDNNFKLIDHPNFVVRSDGEHPFNQDMHIVIGQVAYPIDWHLIGLKAVRVPVGIKFNIAELPVDLSRESIRYTEDSDNGIDIKALVRERVKEVTQILKDLYVEKANIIDIFDYIRALENPKTTIELGGYPVYYGIEMKDFKFNLSIGGEMFSFKKDHIDSLMVGFEGLALYRKEGSNGATLKFKPIFQTPNAFCYNKSGELNHWSSLYHKELIMIRRKKLSISKLYDYGSMLGLTMEVARFGRMKRSFVLGGIRKTFRFIKYLENLLHNKLTNYHIVPETFIQEEKARQEALKEERKGNITYYDENNVKTVATLKSLIEDYQYVFYVNRDAPYEEKLAYMGLYQSFDAKFNQAKYVKHGIPIKPRILVACFSPSVIQKIKNKTKDLTISRRVKQNGKKEWVKTTKPVYAFLSADKMFKFTELFGQFHKLRYTSLLTSHNFTNYDLDRISSYYYDIRRSIPITPGYRIKYQTRSKYMYPYIYFRKQIDAITKNRNPVVEDNLNKLLSVSMPLYIVGRAMASDDTNKDLIIRETIKNYKLTKLKPFYYGY